MQKEIFFAPGELPFSIRDARGNLHSSFLHCHDCLEINYVLSGSGINYIDGRKYEIAPGSVFLINNYEHHFAGTQTDLRMKVILFDPGFVWDYTPESYCCIESFYNKTRPDGNLIRLNPEQDAQVRAIIARMEQEYTEQKPGALLFLKSALLELLALFYRILGSDSNDGIREYQAFQRLRPVMEYIRQNPGASLSLAELAELACMSRTYFCSYFRKTMAMNVSAYIEQVRVRHAQQLLTGTDLTVTEVCMECGYSSLSAFNAAFRKLCDMTPGKFRSSHRAAKP